MEIHKITQALVVDLKDIDDRPGPYCMSFGFNSKPLLQSIKRIGLVNPPLVVENRQGEMTIIIGYRRIQALKSLGWNKIPCKVLSKSDLPPFECLLLNLHDNIAIRKLNDVEKGMVLSRLENYINRTEILEQYMPLLDLPSHEPTLVFFMKLEKNLEKVIKEYLVHGHITLGTAKVLLEMDIESRKQIFYLISSIKLNINQQAQLLDYLIDLSRIYSKSTPDILREHPLESICSDTRMNNPQKAKALLHQLRAKRFPILYQAEMTFKNKVLSLDLPKGIRINAPPYFEGPNYRLEVLFKHGKELIEKIKSLSSIGGLKELGNPWEEDT
jgi:hypothetical protein